MRYLLLQHSNKAGKNFQAAQVLQVFKVTLNGKERTFSGFCSSVNTPTYNRNLNDVFLNLKVVS